MRHLFILFYLSGLGYSGGMLEDPTDALYKAKEYSKDKRYAAKHMVLQSMMRARPEEWVLDSWPEDGGHPGLTHKPTGMQYHAPVSIIPRSILEAGEKRAVIEKQDGKYVLWTKDKSKKLGTHDTREQAEAQETAIQISKHEKKSATTVTTPRWTPSQDLLREIWNAEHTGQGVGTNFPKLPSVGGFVKAYTDPGVTQQSALPGGIRGNYTVGKSYPYETWHAAYGKTISQARSLAEKRYPKLNTLDPLSQRLLVQHTYNATRTPYNKLYQAMLNRDPVGLEREYTLSTKKFPGLKYRNKYYKNTYVDPLKAQWANGSVSAPAQAVAPSPAPKAILPPVAAPKPVPVPSGVGDADTIQRAIDARKPVLPLPDTGLGKSAAQMLQQPSGEVPSSGPAAIHYALSQLNLDELEQKARDTIQSGKTSRRGAAVKVLNAVSGLKRNELKPADLMLRRVPVIPSKFRPFSAQGTTFIPGDANVLYKDLINIRDSHREERQLFGEDGSRSSRSALYDAVKAVSGYGDPVSQKLRQKDVSGFLGKVTGRGPKYSYFQRSLLGKTQDSVGRGTIVVGPDLGLDEVGIPEEIQWKVFGPYVQRRLVQAGMSPGDALRSVAERSTQAQRALEKERETRPVLYSRAPSWHKYNVLAGYAKPQEGDAIAVNPMVTIGLNADFDGDQVNIHLPSLDESVVEAKEKLLPSKMLMQTRDVDKVMPQPKHEQVLGLYTASNRAPSAVYDFSSKQEALAAIKGGQVSLSDEITINGQG